MLPRPRFQQVVLPAAAEEVRAQTWVLDIGVTASFEKIGRAHV